MILPVAWQDVLWLGLKYFVGAGLILLALLYVGSLVLLAIHRIRLRREEQQLRSDLKLQDRVLAGPDLDAKMKAGAGTLIVEHRSPSGPIREWWTADDLLTMAPVALPACISAQPEWRTEESVMNYAQHCVERYLHLDTGLAKLTRVPRTRLQSLDPRKYVTVHLGEGLMTTIYLDTGRKLDQKFPGGKIVTLVTWFDRPLIFRGDAETVFLSKPPGESTLDRDPC